MKDPTFEIRVGGHTVLRRSLWDLVFELSMFFGLSPSAELDIFLDDEPVERPSLPSDSPIEGEYEW